jgi:hypothetical protein
VGSYNRNIILNIRINNIKKGKIHLQKRNGLITFFFNEVAVLKDLSANLKVDFRLGIAVSGSFIDVANVEVGKFPSNSKIVKVPLAESKLVITVAPKPSEPGLLDFVDCRDACEMRS